LTSVLKPKIMPIPRDSQKEIERRSEVHILQCPFA